MTNSLIEFIRSQLLEINQATHHGLNALLPLSPHPHQTTKATTTTRRTI